MKNKTVPPYRVLQIIVPPELHRKVRLEAAKREQTISGCVRPYIAAIFDYDLDEKKQAATAPTVAA